MGSSQNRKDHAVQLSVGSHWIDTHGNQFVVDAVESNGVEIWVDYTRIGDRTFYRCLSEAFEYRFTRIDNY
jgi:hypothetical protein